MKITQKGHSNIQEIDFNNLKFGATFSDHMLICKHKDGKWGEAEIIPYQPLPMMPGMQVFHYGQSVFEGMKAFKTDQGKVLLFREEDNFNRLNKSAKRLCIPEVPRDTFMNGIHELLDLDSDWVKEGNNYSLYIRPFVFASGQCIKATISNEYTFIIITSPTTIYYDGEMHLLIEEKYTFKGNIVITSGSAGGMSNGYLMNNYPEYFKGVCTSVGFVTILLTMLNDKLPLSKIEEEQWGAPRTSKEAFEYILKYDPYYGVKSQPYPQLYFSNSLTDPRVGFYESFKFIQKIREHKKDNHPIIMRCEVDASHAGFSSRWDYLKKDVIPEYAWILKLFNKHKA